MNEGRMHLVCYNHIKLAAKLRANFNLCASAFHFFVCHLQEEPEKGGGGGRSRAATCR